MERILYHASSYEGFGDLKAGDQIELIPGTQNAQGVGVYFSEGEPDVRASDSVRLRGMAALFEVRMNTDKTWWKSTRSQDRKKGRPRTWHTQGRSVNVKVLGYREGTCECVGVLL